MDESVSNWMAEMLDQYRMHLRGEGGLSADEIRKQPQAKACIIALNRKLIWTKRFINLQLGRTSGSRGSGAPKAPRTDDSIITTFDR